MSTCSTCVHWKKFTEKFDLEYHGQNAGTCNSLKFVELGPAKTPDDGLGYWDYENYSAGFETGGKFGCIHWSAK